MRLDGDGGLQRGGDLERELRTRGVGLGSRVAGGSFLDFGVNSVDDA